MVKKIFVSFFLLGGSMNYYEKIKEKSIDNEINRKYNEIEYKNQ